MLQNCVMKCDRKILQFSYSKHTLTEFQKIAHTLNGKQKKLCVYLCKLFKNLKKPVEILIFLISCKYYFSLSLMLTIFSLLQS